ncbi:sigma-70 family RNA polymerase sigma factor [Bacteroidales bacterium OttesenSCG-928-B11]|nr:sigma-70 family RNA polymerase sigma factor [Bacteroidales bacterium OttesenSCG-928-C03]MDL2311514.1 sigma-70 family RNA polymerase sigma factor [Bacteroidales bacterium OttesenSCG-928-B11]MDL2325653.1 sigma-70 family RNA polymerase sigma factor [Bacteroidales bacterium OttesenSCG-928-A14]
MAKDKYAKYSDEELLDRYKSSGDTIWLGILYNRYISLIYGLCLKYLHNRETAKDAVMDIYEMLANKIAGYQITHFKSWIYTVSKNHCYHLLKEQKNEEIMENEEAIMENEDFFTLMEEPQNEAEIKALEYCMGTLPEEQRKSIRFFYLESHSYLDIVEKTGYTMNKVKSYIQNGKRNLKSCIINILNQ